MIIIRAPRPPTSLPGPAQPPLGPPPPLPKSPGDSFWFSPRPPVPAVTGDSSAQPCFLISWLDFLDWFWNFLVTLHPHDVAVWSLGCKHESCGITRESGVCLRISRRQKDCALSLTRVPNEELKAQEQWAVALGTSTRRSGAASEARSGWEGWLSEPKRCGDEVAISDGFLYLADKVWESRILQIPTGVQGVTAPEKPMGLAIALLES